MSSPSLSMAGVRRMQELKYFRSGATMVILEDDLNWLSKRRCSAKGFRKRDGELHLRISSGQMIQAKEERQPAMCFCILNKRGDATPKSQRSPDLRSRSFSTSSSSPQRCFLLKEAIHQSAFIFPVPLFTVFSKKGTWTDHISDTNDIFCLITNILNVAAQKDSIVMDAINRCIIFFDDFRPEQLFSDIYSRQHCRRFTGHAGYCTSDEKSAMKQCAAQRLSSPTTNMEDAETENLNTCNLGSDPESCQNYNHKRELSGRDGKVKRKKSVSFDEDVMVYLFDKESPSLELCPEVDTSSSGSSTCNLSSVTSENTGLEWEDDFLALENTRHSHILSQPPRSWTSPSRPGRSPLPQTCLFLTYVTESDLEL